LLLNILKFLVIGLQYLSFILKKNL